MILRVTEMPATSETPTARRSLGLQRHYIDGAFVASRTGQTPGGHRIELYTCD